MISEHDPLRMEAVAGHPVRPIVPPQMKWREACAPESANQRPPQFPLRPYNIMGNDDWVELTPPAERVRSLHGGRVDRAGFNFVGYHCTMPFMGRVNERSEEAIASELSCLEGLMDEHTILVTHSPAAGVLDSALLGPAGSVSIRDAIRRRGVRAHIHSHIHGSFGRDGRHFNVAAGRQRRAMRIDLNSMIHEVVEGTAQS